MLGGVAKLRPCPFCLHWGTPGSGASPGVRSIPWDEKHLSEQAPCERWHIGQAQPVSRGLKTPQISHRNSS